MPYIDIGPTPYDEECEPANVPSSNYKRMREECNAFLRQLRRQLGTEPEGARLAVKHERDGNDGYYEVVCHYDTNHPASVEYAFKCESEMPAKWDEDALKEVQFRGSYPL
jgi:hypothetical protein